MSFYSDAELMHKLGQITETFISCLKLRDGPFSFDYMEMLLQSLAFYNALKSWTMDNGFNSGFLPYKEIQIYNEEASF